MICDYSITYNTGDAYVKCKSRWVAGIPFKGSGGHWLKGGHAFYWLIIEGCLFQGATYSEGEREREGGGARC